MNLSCSGGGLPESGCLFFKVGGMTDIREGYNDFIALCKLHVHAIIMH